MEWDIFVFPYFVANKNLQIADWNPCPDEYLAQASAIAEKAKISLSKLLG